MSIRLQIHESIVWHSAFFVIGICIVGFSWSFPYVSAEGTTLTVTVVNELSPPEDEPENLGGGGGGGALPVQNSVIFSGYAYPKSKINLLKDGALAATTEAGPDARFQAQLSGLSSGTYTFGVWGTDPTGNRSITYTFTVTVTTGITTTVSGIFLPPTITTDKEEVKRGDLLTILGSTIPGADVSIVINSDTQLVKQATADFAGAWQYKLDTYELEQGVHITKARSNIETDMSGYSNAVTFKVGDRNIATNQSVNRIRGDFNEDGWVNLVDFSIAAYWYRKSSPPSLVDVNSDGIVDLVDFSIIAYHWTG